MNTFKKILKIALLLFVFTCLFIIIKDALLNGANL